MKKIKLLATTAATCLTATAPICISLTSCGGNHDIDIKTNPNIKIECGNITIGKELVITYKLDDGYSFNAEESTIEFTDSNLKIYLWQCDVNRAQKTITVPGEFVTSKKVIIDIKAESTATYTVNQTEYNTAMSLLESISTTRKFCSDGGEIAFDVDKEYNITDYDESFFNINANGLKEYQTQTGKKESGEEYTTQRWAEPAPNVGYWEYIKMPEYSKPERIPTTTLFGSEGMQALFDYTFGRDINKLIYDELFNAYYMKTGSTARKSTIYMKFNNKKIAYMGQIVVDSTISQEKTQIESTYHQISYDAKEVTIPTDYNDRVGMIHDVATRYVASTNKLTYTYSKEEWLGRYVVPMKQCTTWTDDPFNIHIEATRKEQIDEMRVEIWTNGRVLTKKDDYSIDPTTGDITIKSGVVDESNELIIIFARPSLAEGARITGYTNLTIYQ